MANKDIKNELEARKRISQSDIPGISLEHALRVPHLIAEQYGKTSTRPIDVAVGLKMSPTSGPFRQLCGAAMGYGLTDGGPNAATIGLTDLGRRIVAPLEEGDDLIAKRAAVLVPTVERGFLEKYDGSPIPALTIGFNVLESMGVAGDRTKSVFELIIENAQLVGFLKTIKDKTYVDLGGAVTLVAATAPSLGAEGSDIGSYDANLDFKSDAGVVESPNRSMKSNAIFLGHGKNRKPLEQLIKILDEYGIPHREAVAEPNAGRPIPTKVADTMRQCGAAILIFTADEKLFDKDGNEVWRPSENVAHELGASSVLYDNRIVIFKEEGVALASNFNSIGYIEFAKDKLADKGIDLFRELVNFKIVNITIG
jgi:predicted nucleotide-binding protein